MPVHTEPVDNFPVPTGDNSSCEASRTSSLGLVPVVKGPEVDQDDGEKGTQSIADVTTPLSPEEERRLALLDAIPLSDDAPPLAADLGDAPRWPIDVAGSQFPLPLRTRVFTVDNHKGGVGKAATTVNLAAALATAGLRVLVIAYVPQGNASTALGIEHHSG